MGEQRTDAERWWPHLSIDAKHAILADLEGELPDAVREEIAAQLGEPAPERLGAADRAYIRTQVEAVD
jgi:hypothetical protein